MRNSFSEDGAGVEFEEIQRMRDQRFFLVLMFPFLLIGVVASLLIFAPSIQDGTVELWLVLLMELPFLLVFWVLYFSYLRVQVTGDELIVRYFSFTGRKHFAYSDITSCVVREYRPIAEFGGWGVRWGWSSTAYTVWGRQGVQLAFTNRRPLLIGSQDPEALAAAIHRQHQRSGVRVS